MILPQRIYLFLDKYASIKADYDVEFDSEDEKYASPDASYLKYCADMLVKGIRPDNCFSEWSSGGYTPYNSVEGKTEHDSIVKEINDIIKN